MVKPLTYSVKTERMLELIKTLIPMAEDIVTNLRKTRRGNRLAAQRARLLTTEFGKLSKEFRKISIKRHHPKKD